MNTVNKASFQTYKYGSIERSCAMKQISRYLAICTTILALLLTGCAGIGGSKLVVGPEAVTQVDEMLTAMARSGTFTGSVLIAQDGQVLLSEGYGLADRAQQIPNTSQTRFHLGSISKQFTAMAILMLQSQGKLSVKDPICNTVTDCPTAWQDITIHHLLTNTSGLSPQLDHIMETAAMDPATPPDAAYFIEMTRGVPLGTRPGRQYAYSNFGYVLLAQIIEQVSGQSYAAFLEQAIFTPLNMRNSGYEDSSTSGMATGYTGRHATTAARYVPLPISDGEGQLYSTSEDLYLWDQALNTDQLLPRAALEQMFKAHSRESDFPGFGYGYGWLMGEVQGRPVVGGAGWNAGFATLYVRYPEDELALIVLMNQGDINHFSVWGAISNKLLGELPPTPVPGMPLSPQGRLMHHLAYDQESHQVILFGGAIADLCQGVHIGSMDTLDDTWAWDVQTQSWTEMHPAVHPAGRGWGQMVYDAQSDRVILFGGTDAAIQPLDDVWAYDFNTDTWEQVASGPGARWLQGMVYDSESDRVVVYGGVKERGCLDGSRTPELFQDTWSYDYSTDMWTEVVSNEDSPLREGWQFAYSSSADRLFLLGSYDPSGRALTWTYDLNGNAWSKTGAFSYVPDWRCPMVYDSESDRFIVFPWPLDNHIIVFDLNTGREERTTLPSGATFPASTSNNSMVYVEDLDRVFVFSGYSERARDYPTDIWLYNLNTNTWEKVGS
jgi:CubicO group peptidase (beta-lactamase class C family)/N-acetylneuraminic acid mutarotase